MSAELHYYEVSLEPTPDQAEELVSTANALVGGSGLVRPISPGWVFVHRVTGPLRLGQNWREQLPPWAQEVIGREYKPPLPPTLGIPALRHAQRAKWASIRLEEHGWTLDLAFDWPTYAPWQLTRSGRRVDTGEEENDPLLRRLLG